MQNLYDSSSPTGDIRSRSKQELKSTELQGKSKISDLPLKNKNWTNSQSAKIAINVKNDCSIDDHQINKVIQQINEFITSYVRQKHKPLENQMI